MLGNNQIWSYYISGITDDMECLTDSGNKLELSGIEQNFHWASPIRTTAGSWSSEISCFYTDNGGIAKVIANTIIDNVIEGASKTFYVAEHGNDTNSGLNESQPFKTIKKAVDLATPGDTIYVKTGTYNENISFPERCSNLPAQTLPPQEQQQIISDCLKKPEYISLIGYQITPGDTPTISNFDHTYNSKKTTTMPHLYGITEIEISPNEKEEIRNPGTAIHLDSYNDSIIIKNFQITGYQDAGIYGYGTKNSVIQNVMISKIGNVDEKYSGNGIALRTYSDDNVIKDSTIVNAAAEGISVTGNRNIIENIKVYSNDDSTIHSSTDYYTIIADDVNSYGTIITSNHNRISNSYIERVGSLKHSGHGFTLKAGSYNVVTNNQAVNMASGGFVCRHRGCTNNIFDNNHAIGNFNPITEELDSKGFIARDGAHHNVFKSGTAHNVSHPIVFMDTTEDGGLQSGGDNNIFKGINITGDIDAVITFHEYDQIKTFSSNNLFENLNINVTGDRPSLFQFHHRSQNNTIKKEQGTQVNGISIFKECIINSSTDWDWTTEPESSNINDVSNIASGIETNQENCSK